VTAQIDGLPTDEQVEAASETFKLLADPTRLRILWTLLHGEHAVNPLADHVGAQPAAVSQHLAKLRMARVVRSRREGNRIYYLAQDAHVRRLVEEALSHVDHVVHGLPDHVESQPKGARRRRA
jgi:DNA-binding transcriptional ArsR family regulator